MGPAFRSALHFFSAALLVAAAGCGLVLDTEAPKSTIGPADSGLVGDADAGRDSAPVDAGRDSAPVDGGRDSAPPDAGGRDSAPPDAGDPCIGTPTPVDLSHLAGLRPGVPLGLDDGCVMQSWTPSGATIDGSPRVQPSTAGGVPILALRTAAMAEGGLTIHFGSPVAFTFVFDWLSLNPPRGYDERLIITIDDVQVVPSLSEAVLTNVEGTEVRSMGPRGSGRIRVDRATRLGIALRNAGPYDGVGIELHSFEYTALRP